MTADTVRARRAPSFLLATTLLLGCREPTTISNASTARSPRPSPPRGALYEATCVDARSLREFYAMFAGHAPEDFCTDGSVP